MTDIKNTKEILQALRDIQTAYKVAKVDGVNWQDLLNPETRALIPSLREAGKDGKLALKELQDLDAAEALEIYELLSEIVVEAISIFFGVEG